MAADPIAQEARGQGDCCFITINGGKGHLAKPAAEFDIAHFFAQLGADAGPGFGPCSGTLRGRAFAQFFRTPQDDAPFAQLFRQSRWLHHASEHDQNSIAKKPSEIFLKTTRYASSRIGTATSSRTARARMFLLMKQARKARAQRNVTKRSY